jgi:hypothetical protein
MKLPLGDAYFQRLVRQQRGDVARVVVVPYASAPRTATAASLRALLGQALGDGVELEIAPTLAFGVEDVPTAVPALAADSTLAIALFDLTATPEAESQGRFARRLALCAPVGAATIVVVDEAGFKQRFGAGSERLAQRRDAWGRFVETLGSLAVFVDVDAADVEDGARAVQLALRSPVARGEG